MAVTTASRDWRTSTATILLPALAAVIAGLRAADTPIGLGLQTSDFNVYVTASRVLWSGGDIYAPIEGVFPYIYPPLMAVLTSPFLLVPWPVAQVLWLVTQGLLMLLILHRLGLPLPAASMVSTFVILLTDPFRTHMELGQVGVLLMALVVFDIVRPPGWRHRLPAGVGIGIATGIKLTPVVFIIHLFLVGRRKEARTAIIAFLATVVVGFLVTPVHAWSYWTQLAMGDSGANMDASGWLFNISVVSASIRFLDIDVGTTVGLLLSVVFLVVTIATARAVYRRGHALLSVSLLGLASSLANPISWSHHLVFVVPLLVCAMPGFERQPDGHAEFEPFHPLPNALRWLIIGVGAWLCCQPQFGIGGLPGAEAEIHEYTVWEKTLAAMPDILVAVLAVSVLVWCLRMQRDAARPQPMESDIS